jgi:hypothetical protein
LGIEYHPFLYLSSEKSRKSGKFLKKIRFNQQAAGLKCLKCQIMDASEKIRVFYRKPSRNFHPGKDAAAYPFGGTDRPAGHYDTVNAGALPRRLLAKSFSAYLSYKYGL